MSKLNDMEKFDTLQSTFETKLMQIQTDLEENLLDLEDGFNNKLEKLRKDLTPPPPKKSTPNVELSEPSDIQSDEGEKLAELTKVDVMECFDKAEKPKTVDDVYRVMKVTVDALQQKLNSVVTGVDREMHNNIQRLLKMQKKTEIQLLHVKDIWKEV